MRQVLAIAWLRRRLLLNRLRRRQGVAELAGTVLLGVLWGVAAVGAAAGTGSVMIRAARSGDGGVLFKVQTVVFAAALLAGVVLPLLVEKGRGEIVLERLLAYPITPRRLFWMSQAALALSADHLFYLPVLVAVAASVLAGGGAVGAGLISTAAMWLVILAWGQAVQFGVEVLMRGRRSREALAVVVLLLILLMGMGPGVVDTYLSAHPAGPGSTPRQILAAALAVGRTLAPWQAAASLQAAKAGALGIWGMHLTGVLAWCVAGLLVSGALYTRFYLGDRGRVGNPGPVGRRFARRAGRSGPMEWSLPTGFLPPEVVANAARELRVLLRSLSGRLLLVLTPLLMGFIGWSLLRDISGEFLGLQPDQLRPFGLFAYISLTANSFSINNMAFDGPGAQAYFLLPGRLRWVLLGKNLGLWLYQLLVLAVCLGAMGITGFRPDAATLAAGVMIFGILVVTRTLVGNILSCLFPRARVMSSHRERQSTMANLLSLLAFFLIVPVVWAAAALPALLGAPQWRPWGLVLLLAVTLAVHLATLGPVANLLEKRKEKIQAALVRRNR